MEPYLVGFLRQDTFAKKVYFLKADSISEQVLYDFNLPLKDTIYQGLYDTSWVLSFNYFESGGSNYRQINIQNNIEYLGWSLYQSEWIEGFGSTFGLFNVHGFLEAPELICFSSNGITIYPSYALDTCPYIATSISAIPTIQTTIYPNPTTGFCTLQFAGNSENKSAAIFDMTGREVLPLFTNRTLSTFNFNVSLLADELYFVKVTGSDGHVGITKLVKE